MSDGLPSKGIFPRYSQHYDTKFSSMEHMKEHLPNLIPQAKESETSKVEGMELEIYERNKNELAEYNGDFLANELENIKMRERRLFSPNISLTGHQGEVYCCRFSPDGNLLATAGHDKHIMLWSIFNNCANIGHLRAHKNAVLSLCWSKDCTSIFTSSADKTVGVTDAETCKKVKKFVGHNEIVNSVDAVTKGVVILASGSDDNTIKLWDTREKEAAATLQSKYPILSVCFNDVGDRLFSSGTIWSDKASIIVSNAGT